MKYLTLLICMTTAIYSQTTPFLELEDTSYLPSLNPDLKERKTAKIVLENGLKVLLISDDKAPISAASLAVKAGSWDDPKEFPGMAHFCEHMLFMGSEKYPDESEFSSLVSNAGGANNAMTASDRTVYAFSASTSEFLPILDRFSRFFIDPLFNPTNIAKEMHAVDQEFAKSIEHDGWRMSMILKEIGNPDHPHHAFSCGNAATLSNIPQSALQKWHQTHYGANQMYLVLYSSLSLDALKEACVSSFSSVEPLASIPKQPLISIMSPQSQGHMVYIEPIQNKRDLSLIWELPVSLGKDLKQSAKLIAYTLRRGSENSLYENLKMEEWIESVSISVDELGGADHQFFEISLELTDKGLKEIDLVTERVFQALHNLRKTGIPLYLFKEKNELAQLFYQYAPQEDPFSYVMELAQTLPDEPFESYPRQAVVSTEYAPQKINAALKQLTPDRAVYFLLAPQELTGISYTTKEKWMGAEYAIQKISSEWMEKWIKAPLCAQIALPEANPFAPKSLSLPKDLKQSEKPLLLAKNELGIAYFANYAEYQNPEASIRLHLLSPLLEATAESQVLTTLYTIHLIEELRPTLTAASQANIKTSIETDRSRINIQVNGFHEKALFLAQKILHKMPSSLPTEKQFAIYVDMLKKKYANADTELPLIQAKELLGSLIHSEKITKKEKLAALLKISYEDFTSFQKKLFQKTHLEGFFGGNLSFKECELAWLEFAYALQSSPYPPNEQIKPNVLRLHNSPAYVQKKIKSQGNATVLLIESGDFSPSYKAAQTIVTPALHDAFFNELRTKQKTGYITFVDALETEGVLQYLCCVQSNSHAPGELLHRFELFLENFVHDLKEIISEERFESLKKGAIASLSNRFCNIQDKTALLDLLAFQYQGQFDRIEQRIAAIESLSYKEFCQIVQQTFTRDNQKRLAILYEGRIEKPFAYEEISPATLRKR